MARRSRTTPKKRRRGVLRHYHRPIWRDRLFWLVAIPSVLATALAVGALLGVAGEPDSPVGWIRPVLLGVIVLMLSFRMLGAGVTTSRHFQRGLGEGSAPRPNDLEAKGRAAGAVVGRAVRAARRPIAATSKPGPEPAGPEPKSEPEPAADPTPKITVDNAARSVGSMVGRRLSERRKR